MTYCNANARQAIGYGWIPLDETLQELKDTNRESHKEFYKRLNEHDCRIAKLEEKTPYKAQE